MEQVKTALEIFQVIVQAAQVVVSLAIVVLLVRYLKQNKQEER